ncbi:MAG: fatty acyl-AMP ligase [Leptolyngbyaceae cyanobacterium MAG.088]|nr:fatty acyl-AMP ligase [Leptolyngbyaceae cyanobacterium MAG.088]
MSVSTEPLRDNFLSPTVAAETQFLTLVDVLCHRAKVQPEKLAYVFLKGGEVEEESLTYAQLHRRVCSVAAFLQSQLVVGERVLLAYQPGLDFVLAFLACLYAGMIPVPAYPPRRNQKTSRLRSIVLNAQVHIALTSSNLGQSLERFCSNDSALSTLVWLPTDNVSDTLAEAWKPVELSSEDIAFLQYTSGSTGNPKGVIVSHGNLLHNSEVIHDSFRHSSNSQGVIWLPPYHDMGLIGGVLQPLYGGFPVALMSPLDFLQKPLRWLHAVSKYGATTSGGPNFAYDLAVKKAKPEKLEGLDLSSWEVAFTGAEPVRAETLDRFTDTFAPYGFRREAFFPCYGMAESTLIISGGPKLVDNKLCHVNARLLEQNQVKAGVPGGIDTRVLVSCGPAVKDQEFVIVHPEQLQPCSPGNIGEIWVKGPSVAQGYWNQPELTEATFGVTLADTLDGPYLRTGDLGFVQDGDLFVTGRIKDLIIIRGQNHYPQDIELTVEKSHEAFRPNCGAAFAVDVKGAERLVVVYEVQRSFIREIDDESVFKGMRETVAAEHGLDLYAAVLVKTGSIPKTSSGKIRRRACREDFLGGELTVIRDWSQGPQYRTNFQNLQSDVDQVLNRLMKPD